MSRNWSSFSSVDGTLGGQRDQAGNLTAACEGTDKHAYRGPPNDVGQPAAGTFARLRRILAELPRNEKHQATYPQSDPGKGPRSASFAVFTTCKTRQRWAEAMPRTRSGISTPNSERFPRALHGRLVRRPPND